MSPRRSRRTASPRRAIIPRPTSPNIQNIIGRLRPTIPRRTMSPRRYRRTMSPRRTRRSRSMSPDIGSPQLMSPNIGSPRLMSPELLEISSTPRRSRRLSPSRSRRLSPRRSRTLASPGRTMSPRRPSSPTLRELLSRSNNTDPLPNYNNLFLPSYKQALDM